MGPTSKTTIVNHYNYCCEQLAKEYSKTNPGTKRSWSSLWSSPNFVRHCRSCVHKVPEVNGAKQLGLWDLALCFLHWQGPWSFCCRSAHSSPAPSSNLRFAGNWRSGGPYPQNLKKKNQNQTWWRVQGSFLGLCFPRSFIVIKRKMSTTLTWNNHPIINGYIVTINNNHCMAASRYSSQGTSHIFSVRIAISQIVYIHGMRSSRHHS